MATNLLVLLNLGSPASPHPRDVGAYLKEFLMDPYVIDLPWWKRFLLVRGLIVPIRKYKSGHAYQKIWTEAGSPLVVHTARLAEAVQAELGPTWRVEWAMRYGPYRLRDQWSQWGSFAKVWALPLYPQEAKSSTGSLRAELKRWAPNKIRVVEPFFNSTEFISAWAEQTRAHWRRRPGDHLVFSFHGLPERHVREADIHGSGCLSHLECCAEFSAGNAHCYRAQCWQTARAVANHLDLVNDEWSVAFQSGLGREQWLRPELQQVLGQLRERGVRRALVSCPAFVADCLETLEEVGMRTHAWAAEMGLELELLPCLNAAPHWAHSVATAIREEKWPSRWL